MNWTAVAGAFALAFLLAFRSRRLAVAIFLPAFLAFFVGALNTVKPFLLDWGFYYAGADH